MSRLEFYRSLATPSDRRILFMVLDGLGGLPHPETGLTELEAIRACTLDAAEALGLEKELGSIEPGKLADLVVLEGNPAEDITALGTTRMVYQAGARFSPEELRESVVGAIE